MLLCTHSSSSFPYVLNSEMTQPWSKTVLNYPKTMELILIFTAILPLQISFTSLQLTANPIKDLTFLYT